MRCPICTKDTDQLFLTEEGQRCRECKSLSSAQCYSVLVGRIDGSINDWRGLAHHAYHIGDYVGVWESGQQIKHLERMKDSMRKP